MRLDQNIFASIKNSLLSGQYNLLLGSGISTDSYNKKGYLPQGEEIRRDLCALKGARQNSSLQRVYATLTPAEIQEHVIDRYLDSTSGPSLTKLTKFLWHRIFTFNIDDALEHAYKATESLQTPVVFNFCDDYADTSNLSEVSVVHLHGWVKQPEKEFVFSRDEYVRQTTKINPWMVLLTQLFPVEPFIILGASLDEMDLDYYLAHRTKITARDDRGPSVLIEPNPDVVTEHDCEKYNLVLYQGSANDFWDDLLQYIPHRPTPIDLVSGEIKNLLPDEVSKIGALSFASDFELVPGSVSSSASTSRFFYGGIPDWQDFASDNDIGRQITPQLIHAVQKHFEKPQDGPKVLLLEDDTGSGKTTLIRRSLFELNKLGFACLNCSPTSEIEPLATASIIDLIDAPLVIMVDNFADKVRAIAEIVSGIEKHDIVFICAERIYRTRYIQQSMAGYPYEKLSGLKLRQIDAERLIERYREFGLLGTPDIRTKRKEFIHSIKSDPIAIACCRILNDFRPLNGIVDSLIGETSELTLKRYLAVALAYHCYRSGIRYNILKAIAGGEDWKQQFSGNHQMPLVHSTYDQGNFVLPENSVLASRILERVSRSKKEVLLSVFVDLANAIAFRVNPHQIRKRSPEALLAARLFDYDQIVSPLLHDLTNHFYIRTRDKWGWNSRY